LLVRWTDGTNAHTSETESVNGRRVPLEDFVHRLAVAIRTAVGGPLPQHAQLCIGAAGFGSDAMQSACSTALAEMMEIPADQIIVRSDAWIAHKAVFPDGNGIIMICGTGSGCYALDGDTLRRSGGWGPMLGDPASGTALGLDGIRHILRDLESQRFSPLSSVISAALGLTDPEPADILDACYSDGANPAQLAPLILNALDGGDGDAIGIVRNECAALAVQCARLARLQGRSVPAIRFVGGLTAHKGYVRELKRALREALPHALTGVSEASPVDGALAHACQMAGLPSEG